MRVVSIFGASGAGKTTAVEAIVRELCCRGYTVGSVKDIHAEDFSLEQVGSNTYRHREAGSLLVTARGLAETDLLYPRRLKIEEILAHYDQDFVILEGVRDGALPLIIAAKSEQEVDERLMPRVIALTGVLANTREEYRNLPVFSALTRAGELVDFIEEQVDHYPKEVSMPRLIGRFPSKRNRVWLLTDSQGKKFVLKAYPKPKAALEARILRRLAAAGLRVPQVLAQGTNWLRLSYLPGRNLCELWEEAEAKGESGRELLPPFLDWLEQYYALGLSGLSDLNWRNFILGKDGRLAGLDFEDKGGGGRSLKECLGQILAYAITYDPPFCPWKQTWLDWALPLIAKRFNYRQDDLKAAFEQELAKLIKRRKELGANSRNSG